MHFNEISTGDFNFPNIDWNLVADLPLTPRLKFSATSWMISFLFRRTHATHDSRTPSSLRTILDLVLMSNGSLVEKVVVETNPKTCYVIGDK